LNHKILFLIVLFAPLAAGVDYAGMGCTEYTGYWQCPKTASVTGCDDLGDYWSCPKETSVSDLGCEDYGDYVLCPYTIYLNQAFMEINSEVLCLWFGDELMACGANGTLLSPYSFKECWLYYEVKDGQVDYSSVDNQYDCKEKTWPAGTQLEMDFNPVFFNDCRTVEETEYDRIESCGFQGVKIIGNGSLSEENGSKQVYVADLKEFEGVYLPLEWLALGVIVVAVAVWWWKKHKK
jgi:hypothetical protein